MARLSKDQIKTAGKLATEVVSVPEWDDTLTAEQLAKGEHAEVVIQEIMGWQRELLDEYLRQWREKNGRPIKKHDTGLKAQIVLLHCIDEDGDAMFEQSDADWVSRKSDQALNRIYKAALKLSALFQDGVDDQEKNSESAPSDSSGSSSAALTGSTTKNSSSN